MTLDRCIKKLVRIKKDTPNIDFDVILAEGDKITFGFVDKAKYDKVKVVPVGIRKLILKILYKIRGKEWNLKQ